MAPSSSSAYAPIFGSSGLPSAVYSRRLSFFPWSTFMGLFDLKQGSTVISLFALFNKIAGVYGILAVFSGGTFAQVSLYAYSILSIGALLWGLRGISDEDPRVVLRYSHFFAFDHLLSSFWTFFFAYSTFSAPHKGERPPLALHQQGLMDLIENLELQYEIPGKVQHHSPITGEARVHGAQEVWNFEKGFAATVLIAGWLLKIFFALTLYSYALHLRHNTVSSSLRYSLDASSCTNKARVTCVIFSTHHYHLRNHHKPACTTFYCNLTEQLQTMT
ncbi:DUF1753-domain-containing protein [Tilletiaria anomala UBC 951]|uniref:DUF1753-domain-containing protein n=1 Tax=Tilletiaria anomala (strain ATCC 24038 / CBS 436.72 / UBC 951) TaxID=1037660 RepID=A0A066VNU4_TILAU|nr:DUF1753-domain-containing protein [Tilletiaria anomala UBC 951]KDN40429.1 DUF1753-domain-containing protein [Tilletiaria anomala UBC 951]